jgi:hypothetical protein
MDLSGHQLFHEALAAALDPRAREAAPRRPQAPEAVGPALLLAAWSALQSARIEAVDLHLRSGQVISHVVRLRLAGPIAQASTRREGWTHLFPVEELALIRLVARGGHRD